MAKYTALTRIALGGGEALAIGSSIEMDPEKAAPYLRSKALVPDDSVVDVQATTVLSASGVDTTLPRTGTSPRIETRAVVVPNEDAASDEAGGYDGMIEEAIRAFGPGDFTKGGEPRMDHLRDAVQKLANRNGEESGVVIEAEDRDRVFKAMTDARFEVPVADVAT